MERLHDAHGLASRPIETAGRRGLEVDFLSAEFDRLQPSVNQHFNPRRHCRGQAKVVGRGHAVDNEARLVATGDGTDDGTVGRPVRLFTEVRS